MVGVKAVYNYNKGNEFPSLNGFRAVSNLCIVAVHVIMIQHTFIPNPLSAKGTSLWQEYLDNSLQYRVTTPFALALEIFFVLSAFLLTMKCLEFFHTQNPSFVQFLRFYFNNTINRIIRLWPALAVSNLFFYILGDGIATWENYMHTLTFTQNLGNFGRSTLSNAPQWSTSLDFQFYLVFPILLYVLFCVQGKISFIFPITLLAVLTGSVLYTVFTFFSYEELSSKFNLYTFSHSGTALGEGFIDWLFNRYSLDLPDQQFDREPYKHSSRIYFSEIYIPLTTRIGSFIPGALLAISIYKNKILRSIAPENYSMFRRLFSYVFFILSLAFTSLLFLAPPPANREIETPQILVICVIRPIVAGVMSYLIYTTLVDDSHPSSSKLLKFFFSNPLWQPLAKLSFFIYLIHLRIVTELLHPLSPISSIIRDNYHLTTFFIWFLFTLIVSSGLALLYRFGVESPIDRFFYAKLKVKTT